MKEMTCESCQYFRQHYGLGGSHLFRLNCGHCTVPRLRSKKPDGPVCEHFEPVADDLQRFVDREYLTKKLLHKVLEMPLLPPIEEKTGKKHPFGCFFP